MGTVPVPLFHMSCVMCYSKRIKCSISTNWFWIGSNYTRRVIPSSYTTLIQTWYTATITTWLTHPPSNQTWHNKNKHMYIMIVIIITGKKKFRVAWYWNLRFSDCCVSKYLQESTTRWWCMAQLVLFLCRYTRYFFQREASSKSYCNRSCWGQSSGWIGRLFLSLNSTRVLNQFIGLYLKEIPPYTHFYIALYSHFSYY